MGHIGYVLSIRMDVPLRRGRAINFFIPKKEKWSDNMVSLSSIQMFTDAKSMPE